MLAAFISGLALTAGLTLYASARDNALNKNFISCIGSVGVLLMAVSLLIWTWSSEEALKKLLNLPAALLSGE